MGMPKTKAECQKEIKRCYEAIAASEANMSGASGANIPKSLKDMCRSQIAIKKAEIAKLRAHMATLKK